MLALLTSTVDMRRGPAYASKICTCFTNKQHSLKCLVIILWMIYAVTHSAAAYSMGTVIRHRQKVTGLYVQHTAVGNSSTVLHRTCFPQVSLRYDVPWLREASRRCCAKKDGELCYFVRDNVSLPYKATGEIFVRITFLLQALCILNMKPSLFRLVGLFLL